jgi:hypothetical protein
MQRKRFQEVEGASYSNSNGTQAVKDANSSPKKVSKRVQAIEEKFNQISET